MATAFFLILSLLIYAIFAKDDTMHTTIHSSCNDIRVNGLYYIKPLPDLPILPVICSNGYSMLDASLDANLQSYPSHLSSWDYGRTNTDHILSQLDDLSTFREWFIASDKNTKFRVAPRCNECIGGEFGNNTVYYIDSHTFCFSAAVMNGCIEDSESVNYHIESCNQCDVGTFDEESGKWIKCEAVHMSADQSINHDHLQCVAHGLTFHPVLSLNRAACTCYQPRSEQQTAYKVLISELPLVTSSKSEMHSNGFYIADTIRFDPLWNTEETAADLRDSNFFHLYQSDFEDGTFRIKQSGTYIIMEDIVFNFNAPTAEQMANDNFSPNGIGGDELYWFPTRHQAQTDGDYPGLYTYVGAYTLGFFAGITVETDDVTIDLNGFTLKQDFSFYFQQRFFALIELASQPFIPGQGNKKSFLSLNQ